MTYNNYSHYDFTNLISFSNVIFAGACPGGGGGKGPAPLLEIEKQKKGHQSKFEAISPIFCYFFSRKYHFLYYFVSWAPS